MIHVSKAPNDRKSIRVLRALLVLAIVVLIGLAISSDTAQAGLPDVEIEITPASVEIAPAEVVEVLVVARNPGTEELRDVHLTWFTDAGVDVQVQSPSSNVLVPYGTLTWTLRISQIENMSVAGNVHLRLDYVWEGDAKTAPCVAVGSLEVTPRGPERVEQAASIEIESALTSLNEHRPGMVYLIVSNVSEGPIQVKSISPYGPGFVTFTGPEIDKGVTLSQGEAQTFPYYVKTDGPVRPGNHLLLFEVTFEWREADYVWTKRDIVKHEVEVGVFGESGILTAVGVPSFLILPGFLMLLTVDLLWRFVEPQKDFPLKVKSAESGLIAVTLSLLVALVYPVITKQAGTQRNYLAGYDLSDVMWVWFGSIAVATFGYFLVVGGSNLGTRIIKWYKEWRKSLGTPSEGDTPITVLRKLHRQGLGLELERVEVEIQGEHQIGYLLEPKDEGREKTWIGPSIIVEWLAGADEALHEEVGEQLGPQGSPAVLAELLEEEHTQGKLRVRWKQMGQLDKPREVMVMDIKKYLTPTVIIEQE